MLGLTSGRAASLMATAVFGPVVAFEATGFISHLRVQLFSLDPSSSPTMGLGSAPPLADPCTTFGDRHLTRPGRQVPDGRTTTGGFYRPLLRLNP